MIYEVKFKLNGSISIDAENEDDALDKVIYDMKLSELIKYVDDEIDIDDCEVEECY